MGALGSVGARNSTRRGGGVGCATRLNGDLASDGWYVKTGSAVEKRTDLATVFPTGESDDLLDGFWRFGIGSSIQ